MTRFEELQAQLRARPQTWLVTGVAGFIGSHLLESLLLLDQRVVGLDNFSTGHRRNLDEVRAAVSADQWARFVFHEGDTRQLATCHAACRGVDHVLHQAALGSVPRSIEDPVKSHQSNVDGFLHMILAAREAGVKSFVYASSSSVYGDNPSLPKAEDGRGTLLSPYAATKRITELYAETFARCYAIPAVGLRYFNVFGARQDPAGAYAAVIPRWFNEVIEGRPIAINGDGETSRDFCHVENVVAANLLAAVAARPGHADVLNIACGERTTLNELFAHIRALVARDRPAAAAMRPVHHAERAGDVRHSLADITAARAAIGYAPRVSLRDGLARTYRWYRRSAAPVAGIAV